jgi:phage-related protein (TIGR01555 family)
MMKINPDILRDSAGVAPLTEEDARRLYGPAKTNGYPRGGGDVYMAQDTALYESGHYGALCHASDFIGASMLPKFLGYGVLAGLSQDGLIREGITKIADEMIREWIELKRSGESVKDDARITELREELTRFNVREVFREAKELDGYYGGCLVYIDTGEIDPARLKLPLIADSATFKIGSLRGFRVIEPHNIAPGNYNSTDPWSAAYFKPSTWWITGREIHASRFLYFVGNKVSTLLMPAYNFFGLSTTQLVLDVVNHFTGCREAEARLLEKFSMTVFKTDMSTVLQGGGTEELNRRIQFMVQNRSNDGILAINNGPPDGEGEDIIKLETPLSGVTDIVRQSMEMVAAYFGEPVVKMWGISPAGFNATGDADMKNHYEHIASLQEKIFREPLTRALEILQVNRFGEVDRDITFGFLQLGRDDDKSIAEVRKLNADTDAVLSNVGAVSQEEIRSRLAADPDSGYNNIDISDVPEMPQEETSGGFY